MALSFNTVQKTYKIFHALKEEFLPDLRIPSWPEDMGEWSEEKKCNPKTNIVYGWDKKSDDGWESISFFIEKPSEELKARFEELNKGIPNTSLCEPYHKNKQLWVIGWF